MGSLGVKQAYLVAYNTAQAAGWAWALCLLVQHLIAGSPPAVLYAAVTPVLRMGQVCSLLEVVHAATARAEANARAATGLVRTGLVGAFTQWFARTHCLLAVVDSVVEVQQLPWVWIMYLAWAVTEVVRYPWYALSAANLCPSWLTWLRYTVFIPTYPFGVVSEMLLLYHALPVAKATGMYSLAMPNVLNFGFSWHKFMIGGLIYYPFAWLQLYTHMFAQRKKKLAPAKVAAD